MAESQAAIEIVTGLRALYDAALPDKHAWVRGDDTLTQWNTTVAVKVGGETVGVRFRNLKLDRAGVSLPLDTDLRFIRPGGHVIDVPAVYDPVTGDEVTPAVLRWAPVEGIVVALWDHVDQVHPVE